MIQDLVQSVSYLQGKTVSNRVDIYVFLKGTSESRSKVESVGLRVPVFGVNKSLD